MAYTSPSITQSGTTFTLLQSRGLGGLYEALISANTAATAAPTSAPTLSETGSGNTLPTGTYYVQITETNGCGETTPSPTSSGQAITLGQALVVTFPTIKTGNTARNVYVGTASTGPFTLAATGITASSVNITAPLPTNSYAVTPPTANSTGILSDGNPAKMQAIRAMEHGNLQDDWRSLRSDVTGYLAGRPINFREFNQKLRNVHVVAALLNQACAEIGTLIDANPGTIRPTTNPIGVATTARTFP